MAKSSYDYWKEREEANLAANRLEEQAYNQRLEYYHTLLEMQIQQEIDSFYQKYMTAEQINLAEAQKRVTRTDIKQFQAKAKRYVELASKDRRDGTDQSHIYFSKQANQEMRIYNAMMRINRLEMLKAELGMTVDEHYIQMGDNMDRALTKRTDDELTRQAGILGRTVFHNAEDVDRLVNADFYNATWSQRLWGEGTQLKNSLSTLLTQGLIQGYNPRELARSLQKPFEVSRYESERLLRTELARVQTDAQMESFKRNGYDRFMFINNEGYSCSECEAIAQQCQEEGGFLISDQQIGWNAPPIHPNCRCSTAAMLMTRDEYERTMFYDYDVDLSGNRSFTDDDLRGIITTDRLSATKITAEGKVVNPMPAAEYKRLVNNLEKKGIEVFAATSEDDLAYMRLFGAEGTYSQGRITHIGEIPSRGTLYEEIIHSKQARKYGELLENDYLELYAREIEANRQLYQYRKAYRLDHIDTEAVRANLQAWEAKFEKEAGVSYDESHYREKS